MRAISPRIAVCFRGVRIIRFKPPKLDNLLQMHQSLLEVQEQTLYLKDLIKLRYLEETIGNFLIW